MLPIMDIVLWQDVENEEARHLKLCRKSLRINSEAFSLTEARFMELFRLPKQTAHFLINQVEYHLVPAIRTSKISNEIKLFTTLRFYATGCYQWSIGQDYHFGLSQTAVHR